jgi:hypothetical protein
MAFYCKDCSYRGKKSGQLGECPACGSYNIDNRSLPFRKQPAPAKWRLIVLVLLWGCLLAMIGWKLIH